MFPNDFSKIEQIHLNVLKNLSKEESSVLEQAFTALKNDEIDRKEYANYFKNMVYKDDVSNELSWRDKITAVVATAGDTIKGAGLGIYDVAKDTVVGVYDMVTDPIGTVDSLYNAASHPIDTTKYIARTISDSFKRDMINGDAESRAHWVTYALGTLVGTKGAGTATKAGVTTTKVATKNAGKHIKDLDLSDLLPYGPQHQLAPVGPVPFNVVDSANLRDQLI